MSKSINEVIISHDKGLSTNPDFYAGRSSAFGDINTNMLESLYTGVKAEFGDDAAKSYVQVVNKLQYDARAKVFVKSLQYLSMFDWEYGDDIMRRADSKGFNDPDFLFQPADDSKPGTDFSIVREFIQNHKEELDLHVSNKPQNEDQAKGDYYDRMNKKYGGTPGLLGG